jgi:hypothetical protein
MHHLEAAEGQGLAPAVRAAGGLAIFCGKDAMRLFHTGQSLTLQSVVLTTDCPTTGKVLPSPGVTVMSLYFPAYSCSSFLEDAVVSHAPVSQHVI